MRRRWTWRRVAKWSGLGVCVAIVAVFVASGFGPMSYLFPTGSVGIGNGGFGVLWYDSSQFAYLKRVLMPYGGRNNIELDMPQHFAWWVSGFRSPGSAGALIPLWLPLLLVAIPTAILWYRDRRRVLPGHCRCGYDLTGNTSGRCPECGAIIKGTNGADA